MPPLLDPVIEQKKQELLKSDPFQNESIDEDDDANKSGLEGAKNTYR